MKSFLILLLIIAAVLLGLNLVVFQVDETEYAIVKFFGDPKPPVTEPGWYLKWPWPVDEVVRIDKRAGRVSVQGPADFAAAKEAIAEVQGG